MDRFAEVFGFEFVPFFMIALEAKEARGRESSSPTKTTTTADGRGLASAACAEVLRFLFAMKRSKDSRRDEAEHAHHKEPQDPTGSHCDQITAVTSDFFFIC